MATNTDGLKHFKRKLDKLSKKISDGSIVMECAEKGAEIAREKYATSDFGTNETSIVCSAEQISNERARVTAKGDRIAYLEYGTGYYAQGSYPSDKLPSWWQYYYPSPNKAYKATKTTGGEKMFGWNNAEYGFQIGKSAQAQMYHTSVELKEQIPIVIKQIIGGD